MVLHEVPPERQNLEYPNNEGNQQYTSPAEILRLERGFGTSGFKDISHSIMRYPWSIELEKLRRTPISGPLSPTINDHELF